MGISYKWAMFNAMGPNEAPGEPGQMKTRVLGRGKGRV